jgi:PAS domain S-box-containing protein
VTKAPPTSKTDARLLARLQERLEAAERTIRDLRAECDASFELAGVGRADALVADRKIIRVNKALCEMLGYTVDELCGMSFGDLSHPDDGDTFALAAPRILAGEIDNYSVTKRYLRKDGKVIWVAVHASVLPLSPGEPLKMTGLVQDITAQKLAEGEQLENARKFQAIFENSVDAIAVYEDEAHRIVNDAYLKLFGYTHEELKTVTGPELIAPSQRDMIKDRIVRRLRGENVPSRYVSRGLRKDGTEFDLEIHACNFSLEGDVFRLVILRDVTERVQEADAQQKENEALEARVRQRTADLERANRYLVAMNRCAESLVSASDEAGLLQSICSIMANTGVNRFVWAGVPVDDAEKSIKYVAMEGVEAGYLVNAKISWANTVHGAGPIGRSIRTQKVQTCNNTQTDPKFAVWKEAALERGYHSTVALPLMWEGKCQAVISIYAAVPNAFNTEELGMLEHLANDAGFRIATLRVRRDRERLQRELLDSSENERTRIGQDLHDGTCQQLCGIRLFVDRILKSVQPDMDIEELSHRLTNLRDLLQQSLLDVRLISRGLSPAALEAEGLAAALLDLVRGGDQSGVNCKFQNTGNGPEPDKNIGIHLYRIAQEAVGNALKHSGANAIMVRLNNTLDELVLEIADDGAGLPELAREGTGMGLRTMAYRAHVVGGTLEVMRATGGGTMVRCRLKR